MRSGQIVRVGFGDRNPPGAVGHGRYGRSMSTGAGTHVARSRPATLLPVLAVGITLLLWSSAFVAIRHLHAVPPGAMALGRLLIGTVVLALFLVHKRFRRSGAGGTPRLTLPTGRDWLPITIIGLLWFGVYMVALNAAEQRIDAGTASMLVQLSPILIAVLAAVFLRERPSRFLAIGLIVAFGGVVLIAVATSRAAPTGGGGELLGVLLVLLAAVTYSISVIAQKSVLARVPALEVRFFGCLIGTVCCLPFAGGLISVVRHGQADSLWWIGYLGVFPTAIAFFTWAYALTAMTASSLGVTTYLVPPITVLLGWLFLGEVPPLLAVLGGALSLGGVMIARRRTPQPVPVDQT